MLLEELIFFLRTDGVRLTNSCFARESNASLLTGSGEAYTLRYVRGQRVYKPNPKFTRLSSVISSRCLCWHMHAVQRHLWHYLMRYMLWNYMEACGSNNTESDPANACTKKQKSGFGLSIANMTSEIALMGSHVSANLLLLSLQMKFVLYIPSWIGSAHCVCLTEKRQINITLSHFFWGEQNMSGGTSSKGVI